MSFLFLFCLFLFLFPDVSWGMIATTVNERTVIVNHKPTTINSISFIATETDHDATFQIGNCIGTVTVQPPQYNYYMINIASVPRHVIPVQEDSCLVKNVAAYQAALKAQGDQLDLTYSWDKSIQQVISANPSTPYMSDGGARRRLLQSVGAPAGNGPYPETRDSQAAVDQSNSRSKGTPTNTPINQVLLAYNRINWLVEYQVLNLSLVASLLVDSANLTLDAIQLLVQRGQNTDAAVSILTQAWARTYTQLSTNVSQLFAAQNVTNIALLGLFDAFNSKIQEDLLLQTALFGGIQGLLDLRQVDQAYLQSYIDKEELHDMATALAFFDIDTLPSDFIPYLWHPGIRPGYTNISDAGTVVNDILMGSDTRILIDIVSVNYNYVRRGFVSIQLYIYMRTDFAIQYNNDDLDYRLLEEIFGGTLVNCTLPYDDNFTYYNSRLKYADPNTLCNMWVVVNFTSGSSIADHQWTDIATFNAGDPFFHPDSSFWVSNGCPYSQNLNGFCNEKQVLRSFGEVSKMYRYGALNSSLTPDNQCSPTDPIDFPNEQVYISSWRLQSRGSTCRDNYANTFQIPLAGDQNSQIALAAMPSGKGAEGFAYHLAALIVTAYPGIEHDVAKLRLKKFGRTPGVESVTIPTNLKTPTVYDNITGQIIYNGDAQAVECFRSTWNAYHKTTLPLINFIQNHAQPVSHMINVNMQCTPCNDSNVCYTIPPQNITKTLGFSDPGAIALEANFIALGDLNSATMAELYDVPREQLSTSPVLDARFGLSYVLFPPDVTETWDLPTFAAHDNLGYLAAKGTVSPQAFRVGLAYTSENYPYCAVWNGAPDNASLSEFIATSNSSLCVSPFVWRTATFPSDLTNSNISPGGGTTGCSGSSYSTTYSNGNFPSTNVFSTLMTSQFSFSFWYGNVGTVIDYGNTIILAISDVSTGTDLFYSYVVNGQPGIQRLSTTSGVLFDTGLMMPTGSDLRDGFSHHIIWTISCNSGLSLWTIILSVDGVYINTYTAPVASPVISANGYKVINPTIITQTTGAKLTYLSVGSQVDTIVIYVQLLTNSLIRKQYICQQAWRTIPRCGKSTGTPSEGLVIASKQIITSNAGCYQEYDTLFQTFYAPVQSPSNAVTFLYDPSFVLSFWIKLSSLIINYAIIQNDAALISVSGSLATGLTITFFGESIQGVYWNDITTYHHVAIVWDQMVNGLPNLSQVDIYIDGILQNEFQWPYMFGPTGTPQQPVSMTFTQTLLLYNVNYFPAVIQNFNAWVGYPAKHWNINDQIHCELQGVPRDRFAPDVGMCTLGTVLIPVNSNNVIVYQGYCMTNHLCAGHCSTLAIIAFTTTTSTGSFSVVSPVCSTGWSPPSCTERCTRIDPISGICLDPWYDQVQANSSTTHNGLIAGASQCARFRNYRFYSNKDTNMATYTPYHWTEQFTIITPSGLYADILTTTNICVKTSISTDANQQLYLLLENDQTVVVQVYITYYPLSYLNNTNTTICSPPCCNLYSGDLISISPRSIYIYLISACPFFLMGVNVALVTQPVTPTIGLVNCFQGSGSSLQLQIQTAASQLNLQSIRSFNYTEVYVNQTLLQLKINAYAALEKYTQSFYNFSASQTQLLEFLKERREWWQKELVSIQTLTGWTPFIMENVNDTLTAIGDLIFENKKIDDQVNDIIVIVRDKLLEANATLITVNDMGKEVLDLNAQNDKLIPQVIKQLEDGFNRDTTNNQGKCSKSIVDGLGDALKGNTDTLTDAINCIELDFASNADDCSCSLLAAFTPGNSCTILKWISCSFQSMLPVLIIIGIVILVICCFPTIFPFILHTISSISSSIKDSLEERSKQQDEDKEKNKKKVKATTRKKQEDEQYTPIEPTESPPSPSPVRHQHHSHHHHDPEDGIPNVSRLTAPITKRSSRR